jgi:hypothetical protein
METDQEQRERQAFARREVLRKFIRISKSADGYDLNLVQGDNDWDEIGCEKTAADAEFVQRAVARFVAKRENAAYRAGRADQREQDAQIADTFISDWYSAATRIAEAIRGAERSSHDKER